MWKTLCFQQVFCPFANHREFVDNSRSGLHKTGYNLVTGKLRHRFPEDYSTRNWAK